MPALAVTEQLGPGVVENTGILDMRLGLGKQQTAGAAAEPTAGAPVVAVATTVAVVDLLVLLIEA